MDLAEDIQQLEQTVQQLEVQATKVEHQEKIFNLKFLNTQQNYLDAVNTKSNHVVFLQGPNGCGKSFTTAADVSAECLGFEPWSGVIRPNYADVHYPCAVLLPDFDNHARKFYEQNILQLFPASQTRLDRTHDGSPRNIHIKDPRTGLWAPRHIKIFTSKQDEGSLEAGNYQRLHVDEPCSRAHYMALSRGLRGTHGKVTMTMTPLSQPWIHLEIYAESADVGGPKTNYKVFMVPWHENLVSHGGYIPDEDMENFWDKCDPDELRARKYGEWLHLTGRIYTTYDDKVHVIPDDFEVLDPRFQEVCPHVLVIDPHERLPFAMGLYWLTPDGTLIVEDEWPKENFHEMKGTDYTYSSYADVIAQFPPTVYNLMDPNFGRKRDIQTGQTVSDELTIHTGRGFITEGIIDNLATGHEAVKKRLEYNRDEPLSAWNCPKILIRARCKNHRTAFKYYSWQEFTGNARDRNTANPKPQEKYKHFVDLPRYASVYPMHWFDTSTRILIGGPARRSRANDRPTPGGDNKYRNLTRSRSRRRYIR